VVNPFGYYDNLMHCLGMVSNAKLRGKGQEKDKEIMIGIVKN
jgi:hypothetical protein